MNPCLPIKKNTKWGFIPVAFCLVSCTCFVCTSQQFFVIANRMHFLFQPLRMGVFWSLIFPALSVRKSKIIPGIGHLDYNTQNSQQASG